MNALRGLCDSFARSVRASRVFLVVLTAVTLGLRESNAFSIDLTTETLAGNGIKRPNNLSLLMLVYRALL